MRSRADLLRRVSRAAAFTAAIAGVLFLVFPPDFATYDTMYYLVWGGELAEGVRPDYGSVLPPTPHSLAMVGAAIITPLESDVTTLTMVVACGSLGLLAYLAFLDRLPRSPELSGLRPPHDQLPALPVLRHARNRRRLRRAAAGPRSRRSLVPYQRGPGRLPARWRQPVPAALQLQRRCG